MRIFAAGAVLLATAAYGVVPGVASIAANADPGAGFAAVHPAAGPAVFDVPSAPQQATDLPTAEQLGGILTDLTDPAVPEQVKSGLVQGGFDQHEDHRLDHALHVAEHRGQLPLTYTVSDIASPSPGNVTADVTATGPRLGAPIMKTVAFTDQNGWVVSYDSAAELVEEITGRPEQ